MLDQFDESDLLALIEDELGPEEAAALSKRLGREPRALEVIQSMRRDRELLRSLGEPPLPVDLLAELEPRLARSMLMAPTGDDLRRRQRRERRRYGPLAAAAGIGLVLFVGGWFIVSGLLSSTGSEPTDRVAMATDPAVVDPIDGDTWRTQRPPIADQSENGPVPAPGSTIHHRSPLDIPGTSSFVDANVAEAPTRSRPRDRQTSTDRSGATELLAAGFAIVLRSADAQNVERSLKNVAMQLGDQSAVVRNFNFHEAQRLAAQWLQTVRAQVGQRESEARFDLTGPGEIDLDLKSLSDPKLVAIWAKNQLESPGHRRGSGTPPFSEQLHGSKSLAPSLAQQLEYAQRGAAYTIAIPASQLRAVLARMQMSEAQTTTLRMLTLDDAERSEQSTDALRLVNYAQAREAADRLIAQSPEAVILLPVVIQSP